MGDHKDPGHDGRGGRDFFSDDEDRRLEGESVSEPHPEPVKEPAPAPARERAPLAAPKLPRFSFALPGKGLPLWAKVVGIGAAGLVIASVAGAAMIAIYLGKLSHGLPDYKKLAAYSPSVTTRVYGGDGSLVAEFARERRLFVPVEAIPERVQYAFVSAEDKSFFEHDGLDTKGIVRAQLNNIGNILAGRRLEGGSTITQQVAKNFLLSSERKVERKIREMMVTQRIEKAFTKQHILELYLNEIYLGNRSYGVAAAALNYFDKPLEEITVAEAAYLAALTKGPTNYHPIRREKEAVERRNWVVDRMYEDQRITKEERDEALKAPLGAQLAPELGARDWAAEYFAEEVRKQIAARYKTDALYDGGLAVRTTIDPHLQSTAGLALRKWLGEYDRRHGWRGPVASIDLGSDWKTAFSREEKALADAKKIAADLAPWQPAVVLKTSAVAASIGLDGGLEGRVPLDQMQWARAFQRMDLLGPEVTNVGQVLKRGDVIIVEKIADKKGVYALRQIPSVNGALVALDPHTGRVLAMVGGYSFQMSEFNRAIQADRQPGSTFKPFVYAAALDSGYTPSSIVLDAPFVAPSVGSWWKPGNYTEGRFYGESTLRLGIEQSRNTMTARLAQDLGIGRLVDYVSRFKLSDSLPRELAISLGAAETTLMKITAGYSTFVNGGKLIEPYLVDRVQDRTGKTIFRHDARSCEACNQTEWSGQAEPQLADNREQIIDPRTAYQITSMLEGVIERGTGKRIRSFVPDKPIAGKTGTTNDYKDAWFIGFSPDLAAGVWVGFDTPQPLGEGEAGGSVAAPVFGEFMAAALKDKAAVPFRVPSGIRLVRVNAKSGRPASADDANVILEAFKSEDTIGAGPSSAASSSSAEGADEDLSGIY